RLHRRHGDGPRQEILRVHPEGACANLTPTQVVVYSRVTIQPTRAYFVSWMARIFSLKNSRSRNPDACRFLVLIWWLVPSSGPLVITTSWSAKPPLGCAASVWAICGRIGTPGAAARRTQPSRNVVAKCLPGCPQNRRRSSFR